MDVFQVEVINQAGDQRVTCRRCGKDFVVDNEWPGDAPYVARPCPSCFKASRIPGGPALVYDGRETLRVTVEEAQALLYFRIVTYSPHDGPNGLMYRPSPGKTMDDVRSALVR